MSNDARTATKPQLEIIQHIIQDLLSHYDSEEVERMWRLICQDREENVKKKKTSRRKEIEGNNKHCICKQSKVKTAGDSAQ
ncbi:MAG TPA: hypothetical protein VJ599_04550 [Nitrososphaeraceae archaeon]|nr:hypothetical protein [Nitrososphaeraceae archaeon]